MANKRIWNLRKETELRCEVSKHDCLTLSLTAGSAEVFGVEMAMNKEYSFRDQNIAVFTWYGCTIESWGAEFFLYVVGVKSPMIYTDIHDQLQAMRDVALNNRVTGPRVRN